MFFKVGFGLGALELHDFHERSQELEFLLSNLNKEVTVEEHLSFDDEILTGIYFEVIFTLFEILFCTF